MSEKAEAARRTPLNHAPEPPCECPGPGFCQRYKIQQGEYHWKMCRAENCDEKKSQGYRQSWARRRDRPKKPKSVTVPAPARTTPLPPPPADGVGSELKAMLARYGFQESAGCGCEAFAGDMNRWGVAGCEARRDTILGWLNKQAEKRNWWEKAAAWAKAAAGGLVISPKDPAASLLDEAVRRYSAKVAARPILSAGPWRLVTTAGLVEAATRELLPRLPPDLSGVCGVSRSGMLPAAALAAHLHLPLWEVNQHAGKPRQLGLGVRGAHGAAGPLLVVDDTVYSGRAMTQLRRRLGDAYRYAAVFALPGSEGVCDFVGQMLPSPHLLEWNLVNSLPFGGHSEDPAMRGGVALDFDGVICVNPTAEEVRNPLWLEHAKPLLLPRMREVPLVVTARHEDYRQYTLGWCARWGVSIRNLEMWREEYGDVARWKAKIYANSVCSLYVESEPGLAEAIAMHSGKPVACPAVGKVFGK